VAGDDSPEARQLQVDASREALARAERGEQDARQRLEREVTALEVAQQAYVAALTRHLNRKVEIARLRVHIRDNILYYMQAIWSHEPPDQRFFRLHKVPVPRLDGTPTYDLERVSEPPPLPPAWRKPLRFTMKPNLSTELTWATLAELADLDNLLGFKGNYAIFPLREQSRGWCRP